ncbi:16S rRNA (cytidine(1402)-2'-O)-methyltransferase [Rubritalea marina]|uniref:16S rRNA (cytidine(1402)-2'-O)-methyltransferase n=1 Tax=Rubritalea marina TaxID=361055 RepID=UPI000367346D|nr:16S rRNA (cytidine(1402)-2'-O)-methyltransferase [Rubritalea marina]
MVSFVPTPIGNRGDITQRAIEVLSSADLITCEDTRHSRPLLEFLGVAKPVTALHDHNEAQKTPELVARAKAGDHIAVITDAGMPAISDPGYRLMQACIEHELDYTVLPGPSAVLTALVGSGFPLHAFFFGGFLPVKKGKRSKMLEQACQSEHTSIFFESPHRLLSTLEILNRDSPDQMVCVARELTKKFETYHRGSSAELFQHFSNHKAKGEIVLLISPNDN